MIPLRCASVCQGFNLESSASHIYYIFERITHVLACPTCNSPVCVFCCHILKSFQHGAFQMYSLGLNGSCCMQTVLEYVALPLTRLLLWVCAAPGGRDRRGGPVLTFPSRSNHDRIRTEDLRRLIAYLAGIPRCHIQSVCTPLCARVQ